jgi:hypothetical protein
MGASLGVLGFYFNAVVPICGLFIRAVGSTGRSRFAPASVNEFPP